MGVKRFRLDLEAVSAATVASVGVAGSEEGRPERAGFQLRNERGNDGWESPRSDQGFSVHVCFFFFVRADTLTSVQAPPYISVRFFNNFSFMSSPENSSPDHHHTPTMATMVANGNSPNMPGPVGPASKRYRPAPAKTFQCRGYGDCRMVFSRSEHLARHIRFVSYLLC